MFKSRLVMSRCIQFWRNKYSTAKTESSVANDGLLISDSCAQKLKQLCDNSDKFLRLCVESGGCSGFQYKFDLDSKLADDDRIFEKNGAKVVIDETSLEYIRGATVDYHTELIRSAFRL
ncbi:Iron-sulfur cluster assembly 2-like protein, mitochondrial [Operophtera brumata]|uniref:Iron-sulfur cluster assembly 2 homolog, mitochondrial n=1 Tax=Operophtera brumata TaxID=104452 RepID=A0A0L7L838_OPEBR|nr:Iron-sulfur cluster assembly 2-like protein, mitochondrial [Operophtera brumata]